MDDEDDGGDARAPEPEDVVRICRALNEAGARYLLIGGFAVIAHGAGRFTSIPLASPRTLIRTKDTKRPQDAMDRAFLEGVLRARSGSAGSTG